MNNNLYQLNKILIPTKYEYPKLEKFLEDTIILWGIDQNTYKIKINYKNLKILNRTYTKLINSKYPPKLKKKLIVNFKYWHMHKNLGFTLKENKIIKRFFIKAFIYKQDNKKSKDNNNKNDNATIDKLIKKLSNNNNDNDNDTGPTLGKRKPKSNEPEL